MCDTILATPVSTSTHNMLFGKNSDRRRNEAQAVEYHAAAEHAYDAIATCTYISIPQIKRTHAVLICRPFWIWGAEMGANEYGVVIGNEGLQSRGPPPQDRALIGMDLIRLALERASSATQALGVITSLLQQYGQGGDCGHLAPTYYQNSFMIADARDAFLLETIGREWVLERVRRVRAISNRYSVGREADRVSSGLLSLIHDSGWSSDPNPNYAEVLADPQKQHIGTAQAREACGTSLMKVREGRLRVLDMMNILREHGTSDSPSLGWHPECMTKKTICMHAGSDELTAQSVGSMVSELSRGGAVHWVTGTAAPCISIFKPVLLDTPLPSMGPAPTDRFDPSTLWWRHELLHRAAIVGDFGSFLEDIRAERHHLEADFEARVRDVLNGGNAADRARVVADCWRDATRLEAGWHSRIKPAADAAHVAAWRKMNQLAGLETHLTLSP